MWGKSFPQLRITVLDLCIYILTSILVRIITLLDRNDYEGKKSSHSKEFRAVNNLTLYLKEQGREEQIKPKVSKRKEIIKIRKEVNEIET